MNAELLIAAWQRLYADWDYPSELDDCCGPAFWVAEGVFARCHDYVETARQLWRLEFGFWEEFSNN